MRFLDDCDAYEDARARKEADEAWIIDAAFADILQGRFDSEFVHEALQLGHHEGYPRLKEARDAAELAARHSGGAT